MTMDELIIELRSFIAEAKAREADYWYGAGISIRADDLEALLDDYESLDALVRRAAVCRP